jgi:membrane associated rhomboid family serine protease
MGNVTVDPPPNTQAAPICFRHPDREGLVRCTRCHRNICPDCMRVAPVGHHCVDCVGAAAQSARQPVRTAGTPVLTYGLIAINVVMFVLQKTSDEVFQRFAMWSPGVATGDVYRLLTSAFLHLGIAHLLLNMLALFFVGPALERWLGRPRFAALYVLSTLGGAVLVYLLTPVDVPTVGASGAIFGLFGATFALARRLNLDMRWVVGYIVVNLVFTFAAPQAGGPMISWQDHVGGLVTGAAVGAAFAYAPAERRTRVQAGFVVAVVLLLAALVLWRTASLSTAFGW